MAFEIELDPELMAGQMVIAGFEGKKISPELKAALSQGRLSGVILFERNLGSPEETRALTDEIRAASAVPPLIAIDHEGGRVQRLKAPFTIWPSARALGQKGDTHSLREIAAAMAAELLAAGVNLNLAPVADVDSNPDNPVIGDRSFGEDPSRVAHLAAAMIEGFSAAGLVSCAKHFPGHGDAAVDSHEDLPEVTAERIQLERRELPPFVEAIKAHVPMIMTAHLKATALDPYYPATISRPILLELLREEMGFDGVIITDDLEMKALGKYMTLPDAAFSAAKAGADLLLVCSSLDRAELARKSLVDALKHGVLDFGEITRSVRRVLALKEKFLSAAPPHSSALRDLVGQAKHQELARDLT